MTKYHRTLMNVSWMTLLMSVATYLVGCIWLVSTTPAGHTGDVRILIVAQCGVMLSLFGFVIAWGIGQAIEQAEYNRRRERPSPTIPLQAMEKEPGYNDAVTHWFLNGPELRQPGEDFAAGFERRAIVPPPKRKADPNDRGRVS